MIKKLNKKVELKLRPHHVLGYWEYLKYLQNPKREKNYLKHWKKIRGDSHSDKLVLHWEKTLKKLQKNAKFKYVTGFDSVCKKCEHADQCHESNHEFFKKVKEWDDYAKHYLPELKFGKIYGGNYLKELFKKKGWLNKEK